MSALSGTREVYVPAYLCLLAEHHGIDITAQLGDWNRSDDAAPPVMTIIDTPIDVNTYTRLVSLISRMLDVEGLPTKLADMMWNIGGDDIFVSLRRCGNLREVFENYEKYAGLFGDAEVTFEVSAGKGQVRQHFFSGDEVRAWQSFANLIFLLRLVRPVIKRNITPREITYAFDPANDGDLAVFFDGVAWHRGDANILSFSQEDLEIPFITADPIFFQGLAVELDRRVARLNAMNDIEVQLRAAIHRALPAGNVSLAAVAKIIGIGGRTLQRRLNENGCSYGRILNDERQKLVTRLLADGKLSKAEIAYRVGYHDPNSLYRMLTRWQDRDG
jgi:AraC-like DNA-binding protein